MPIVNGTLTDFGLDPLTVNNPELIFRASSTGLAGLNILSARKAVEVVPAANGYFEADLVATTLISPETTHYTVEISYRDAATGMRVSEILPWKLLVPPEGGTLGDLLRVPANPALVWTGEQPPIAPSPGTWWLDPATGELSELDGDGSTWLYKASLRGPAGFNATGAAEDDAAVAAFITGAGTATSAALRGSLDARYGRKRGTFEFYDDYSKYPDGPVPATAATGQANSLHSATDASGLPIIAGGYMTYSDAGYLGGYVSRQLDDSVVRIGASFAFTPWSTGGGLMCIAVMEEDIHATQLAGQGVPRSPFHLTISPQGWGLDVFTTKGQPKVNVAGGVFSTALTADGVTLHRAEGIIDRENKTVYLTLPDGARKTLTHESFGIAARWIFDEPFRDSAAAGKTLAKFRNVWADSRSMAPLVAARAAAAPAVVPVKSTLSMPAGNNDMTLTVTASKVAGTDTTYTVPPSTNVLVRVGALLEQTTDGPVYFGIFNSSNALIAVGTVSTKGGSGARYVEIPIALTAGAAGGTNTISMCAYRSAAAVAKILLGNYTDTAGANVYARASLTVTPL